MTNWGQKECRKLIIEDFDILGILPHTLPNAIGMWPNEQECLVWCAQQCDTAYDWWEIGSFCGGSTVLLGLTRQNMFARDGFVCAVDPTPKPIIDLNIKRAKLNNTISQVHLDSFTALRQCATPIGFLFLDGYHSFRNVVTEFELARNNLTNDAVVAFHDCSPNMWTNSHQTHIRNCYERAYDNYDQWMESQEEDFYIDEAIAYICTKYDYKIIDIPIREPLEYHRETGLNEWVRGRTSPHNAFTAIRKKQ